MYAKDIERRFQDGQTIVERGSPSGELYVVREGNVLLQWQEGEPPQILGAGELFGDTAVILGHAYDFEAEAEGEVTLLAIDMAMLQRLLMESPEFAFRLVRSLAQRAEPDFEPAPDTSPSSPHTTTLIEAAPVSESGGGSAREVARVVLARVGDGLDPVPGRLVDLAHWAGLDTREAYLGLRELIDRRWLRLVDDVLSVVDVEALRAFSD